MEGKEIELSIKPVPKVKKVFLNLDWTVQNFQLKILSAEGVILFITLHLHLFSLKISGFFHRIFLLLFLLDNDIVFFSGGL